MQKGTWMEGIVKEGHSKKGWGYITVPGEEQDIFFHHTEVLNSSGRLSYVVKGQTVSFYLSERERGYKALNVRVVE